MKILNLVNKDASDIKYQVHSFPDGQQQVVISFEKDEDPYYVLNNVKQLNVF